MDGNTMLLLAKAAEVARWEDQDPGNYDVDHLRQEFRNRLYATDSRIPEEMPPAEKKPTEPE